MIKIIMVLVKLIKIALNGEKLVNNTSEITF